MKLEFDLTAEDYLEYNEFYNQRSSLTAKRVLFFRISFPCVLLLLSALIWFTPKSLVVTAIILSAGIICISTKRIIFAVEKINMERLIKNSKANDYLGKLRLEFQDEKIRSEREGKVMEISYNLLTKVEQDSKRLYIFAGEMAAYIIPLSVFENNEEKRTFIKMIIEKTQKSREAV